MRGPILLFFLLACGSEPEGGDTADEAESSGRETTSSDDVSSRRETTSSDDVSSGRESDVSSPSDGVGRETRSSDGEIRDGFFRAEGSPDPRSCASDDECTYGGAVGTDGCCWTYRDANATPLTKAYSTWQNQWRAERCATHECPPPPVPTQPPDCLFEVTCVDDRCANACD